MAYTQIRFLGTTRNQLKIGLKASRCQSTYLCYFLGGRDSPPLRPIEIGKIINHDAQKLSKKN